MTAFHKINSGIDNECKVLVADIASRGEKLKSQYPDIEMEIRRSPERVTFQVGALGLSLSWFKSRQGEPLSASVMVAGWEGQITFPGQTALEGRSAKQVSETIFQLILCEDLSWKWAENSPDATLQSPKLLTSTALVDRCVSEIEEKLLV